MSRVHYLEGDYEQLVINETIDGLFSSYRIDRNSLPKGFFLYEIRWDDSLSSLAEISPATVPQLPPVRPDPMRPPRRDTAR